MEISFVADISKFRDLDTRMAERRGAGTAARDLARPNQVGTDFENPFSSPLGWLGAVLLNLILVLAIGLATVLVPPVMACSEQNARGFYAGDSFGACASRAITARFQDFDGRIRKMILNSGE